MKAKSSVVRQYRSVAILLAAVLCLSTINCRCAAVPSADQEPRQGKTAPTEVKFLPLSEIVREDSTISSGTYVVEKSISVADGAVLVIEPGTTLRFKQGAGIVVMSDGRLSAKGTARQPILLTGLEPQRGYWNGVHLSASGSTENELQYVTIEYGGGYKFFGWEHARANLVLSGLQGSPTRVSVSNCTLRESAGYGFFTRENIVVRKFDHNTVTKNASGAGWTSPAVPSFLDDTTAYQGNDHDVVHISGDHMAQDQHWNAIDAGYEIADNLTVGAHWTIAAGSRLVFQQGAGITVLSNGSLTAVGAKEEPILFTAAEPTRGYWSGLHFSASKSAKNKLDWVTIEYGGGYKYFGWESARTNLVLKSSQLEAKNSTFRQSAGWGAWISNDSQVNADIALANQFEQNVAGDLFEQP